MGPPHQVPNTSRQSQKSRLSSSLEKPGNPHQKKHSRAKLTRRRALQGCDGTFGSVPSAPRLEPWDSPVSNCPWHPRGQYPTERSGSPQEEAAAGFSPASYCQPPREGFAVQGKESRRVPITACFQRGLFPTSSQRGLGRQQQDTVTKDYTRGLRRYSCVSDGIGTVTLFLLFWFLFVGWKGCLKFI